MQKFGVDISKWQGDFNLAQAKAEGVEFVIVKAGGSDAGRYKDKQFENNYNKCKQLGIPVGAYYFSKDLSVADAEASAEHFIGLLKGKQFELPIYMDVEHQSMLGLGKQKLTDVVETFCNKMEEAGYYVGIYSSESFFRNQMDESRLSRFTHWIARWSKMKPSMSCGMWQFGGEQNYIKSNKIAGVVCDQDYLFQDFETVIKKKGLNGFNSNGQTVELSKPVDNSFKVEVTIKNLYQRKGPGVNYSNLGFIKPGVYTVYEEVLGWGHIKETGLWICLKYARRM